MGINMHFCAHAIFLFEVFGGQDLILVHENVYLVAADGFDEAKKKANEIAKGNEDLSEDGHLEVDGRKARYIFAGIRKVIEVEPHPGPEDGGDLVGLEVTYSEFEVASREDAYALARGESVKVTYLE
jgi:Domain of unknown function (DUF4288)